MSWVLGPLAMIVVWLAIRAIEQRQAARPAAAAAPEPEMPAAGAMEAPGIPELTDADQELLAGVQTAYPDLHPKAVQRGVALANLMRAAAPDASDAELSRGVLRTSHLLGYVASRIGDPGHFWSHVITELDVAALDLTLIEISEPELFCDP